jgi:hypothetical protein
MHAGLQNLYASANIEIAKSKDEMGEHGRRRKCT